MSAEEAMIEILVVQMAALVLAWVSTGIADCAYHNGHVGDRVHSLWVALSLAAMYLPVVAWVVGVFVGVSAAAHALLAVIEAGLFVVLYRNLRSLAANRKPGLGFALPRSAPEKAQTRVSD